MSTVSTDPDAILAALAAPFGADEVEFVPGVVSGNRALAMPYIDARCVQDRLDAVMGVAGWSDDYEVLPDHSVICRLRLRIGGEWIVKCDVGAPSDQKDNGDKMKAAFSGALKRAAVKFAIGRYLYSLPAQWADFDPQKKRFTSTPMLPGMHTRPSSNGQKTAVTQTPAPQKALSKPAGVINTALASAKQKEELKALAARCGMKVAELRADMKLGPDDQPTVAQWRAQMNKLSKAVPA